MKIIFVKPLGERFKIGDGFDISGLRPNISYILTKDGKHVMKTVSWKKLEKQGIIKIEQ